MAHIFDEGAANLFVIFDGIDKAAAFTLISQSNSMNKLLPVACAAVSLIGCKGQYEYVCGGGKKEGGGGGGPLMVLCP